MTEAISRILIWFRNDLRLHDHQPITQALEQQGQIIPFFCFDPRQFEKTSFGFPKTGAFRSKFLWESVAALRQSLRERGSDLLIYQGFPEAIIPQVVTRLDIEVVYFHHEVTSEEVAVEKNLRNALATLGVKFVPFWGSTLLNPDRLPFQIQDIPEVFTQFRQQVEKQVKIEAPLPSPASLPSLPDIAVGELSDGFPFEVPAPTQPSQALFHFSGGETAALQRVQDYIWERDRLRCYKETRNSLLQTDDSSKFSPWLALGCLSPRYIYAQIKAYERERVKNDSTYWLGFELLWRDYFRFICAKHGKTIFRRSGLRRLNIPWQEDRTLFEQWKTGHTGFPLVDANMRELASTGFMSNRGRQVVASFLTKNLGINWQMGAEWFESTLIDYDVCSNWGNWNYAAGIGNDARGFRWFNIAKQASTYDPQGEYVKHWLPELRNVPQASIHQPWMLTSSEQQLFEVTIGQDYPLPIVDLFQSARSNEQIYNTASYPESSSEVVLKVLKYRRQVSNVD
jgi:deoxyribodipyrimidine photo-lyase